MIWLILAATGLAVIAKTFAGMFVAIKFAGAAYLLYLAWRMATAPAVVGAAPTEATRGWRAFLGSLSLTLGNPKVMVFFLSIMPLVVDVRTLTALALFELALVCGIVISATLALYALAANRARTLLRSTRATRFVNRAAGGLMAGAARRNRHEVGVSDLLAIGEALVELNQPKDGAPFVQGFGGDTSNAMIAAARLGADAGLFHRHWGRPIRAGLDRALAEGRGRRDPDRGQRRRSYRALFRNPQREGPRILLYARRLSGEPDQRNRSAGRPHPRDQDPAHFRHQPGDLVFRCRRGVRRRSTSRTTPSSWSPMTRT